MHRSHHSLRYRLPIVLILLALVAAACGGESKVGDESLLNFKDQVNDDRLGERTTTVPPTTAPADEGPKDQKAGIQKTETTPPPTAPPTTRPETTADISINGDNSGTTQFNPSAVRVFVGTIVKWVNKDSVPRSVESDDAETFATPMIPPGGSFSYKTDKVGRFNYHDGTRPYAVGVLEVLPR